jgi:hypothetical protein
MVRSSSEWRFVRGSTGSGRQKRKEEERLAVAWRREERLAEGQGRGMGETKDPVATGWADGGDGRWKVCECVRWTRLTQDILMTSES